MTSGRYRRHNSSLRPPVARRTHREENFFLGMVGFSLVIHVIAAAIFLHNPTPVIPHRPPTVYVDLVMAPVANPQRGSAGAIRKSVAPPQPAVPTKVAKEQVVVKGKETKKTAEPKDDDGIAAAMAKMKQRKTEQAILNDAQSDMEKWRKKRTTPTPQAVPTVGSASGTGDEAGSAVGEWLQHAVKEKWSWPDRKRKDLSAEVEVEFNIAGKLSNYRFIRSSTDARFDDSLKRALLSLEPLPTALRKPYKETILFNLDDLQGQ